MCAMTRRAASPLASLLERSRRRQKLSLREASQRLGAAGARISHSTLLRIEQGKLEPAAVDLFRLAVVYDLPQESVLDAVEAERLGAAVPAGGTLEEIVKSGEE